MTVQQRYLQYAVLTNFIINKALCQGNNDSYQVDLITYVSFFAAAFGTYTIEYRLGRIYGEAVMFGNMSAYLCQMITVEMYELTAVQAFKMKMIMASFITVYILKAGAGLAVK